ncbi:MAG: Metallo-dependent phosphatase-like protein [Piptocephalis tieghemiana]|nr:MAG: Metallo-dependent phosphatase-like protein [Piptocephalis tieghemiana]
MQSLVHARYTGHFLHITDFHPDPHYLPAADVRSACHRYVKRVDGIAGEYGSPGTKCDAPYTLVNATLQWISSALKDQVDFVIWTGDNARHDNDRSLPRSEEEIFSLNEDMVRRVRNIFPTSIPIVPTIGNNDIYPHNVLFPGPNPTFSKFLSLWHHFIPEDQNHVFLHGGYFSRPIISRVLTVISLNTIFFYSNNGAVGGCRGKRDPGKEQLRWLRVQLEDARSHGTKVYIIGHVAPNRKLYYKKCFRLYARIALTYQDVLIGQFFGHNNVDHFFFLSQEDTTKRRAIEGDGLASLDELLDHDANGDEGDQGEEVEEKEEEEWRKKDLKKATEDQVKVKGLGGKKYLKKLRAQYKSVNKGSGNHSIIFTSPSVIPTYYPALRLLHYDPGTGSLNGWSQYWCNLTQHNLDQSQPTYHLEYDTAHAYGLTDLSTPSMIHLASRLAQENPLWRDFVQRFYVNM